MVAQIARTVAVDGFEQFPDDAAFEMAGQPVRVAPRLQRERRRTGPAGSCRSRRGTAGCCAT